MRPWEGGNIVKKPARGRPRGSKEMADALPQILTLLKSGLAKPTEAAVACGVKRTTHLYWMREGAKGNKYYTDYFYQIEHARHVGLIILQKRAGEAGRNDWKYYKWKIEQQCPEEYVNRSSDTIINIENNIDATVNIKEKIKKYQELFNED